MYAIWLWPEDVPKTAEYVHCFECMARDADHAEEQARNQYPNCRIDWTELVTND